MKKQKPKLDLLIPFIVAGVFAAFNLLGFYRSAENRVYDLLLRVKPAVPENPALLFLDIDDTAIAEVGTFPWSRDIMADGLVVLKEFGAAYAVFDIEYVDPSPRGVNAQLLEQEVPELFTSEFDAINQHNRELFQALRKGMIGLGDAQDYIGQLEQLTETSRKKLLDKVNEIARDNDAYLGRAARLFGSAFFTVNMVPAPEEKVSAELRSFVLDNIALPAAQVPPGYPFVARDIRPAILPVIRGARGAGFPNVIVDSDGVRRRVDLVMGYSGHYFAQLGFAALLDWLGRPEVLVQRGRIILKGARVPGKGQRDIVIPLAEDRRFLINWPKKSYSDSFRHMTYYKLVQHRRLEQSLLYNLRIMDQAGYLGFFSGSHDLLDTHTHAERILQEVLDGGDPAGIEEYRQARATFFQDVGGFLEGQAESSILSQLDTLIASKKVKEQDRENYRQVRAELPQVFAATREIYRSLAQTRATLAKELEGSFCVVGWTGTSTTDIGVNPFEEKYMNIGTHAAVVNTILSGRFLDALPWWISALAAAALAVAMLFAVRRLRPLPSILIGLGFLALLIVLGVLFFLVTGTYLRLLTPVLSVFFTLFVLILFKFMKEEQDKSYIRSAFSHYLSNDVVNEVLSDRDKLNLGGEKKYLTALFTDIRDFSTLSESMDPKDLVKLLNLYLTDMSRIIIDLRGTVDKYEGDAIIAFFGAPQAYEDHAVRACTAAVRMKKMEERLNEHFLTEKLSPTPLHTRIGINTGEMVVGNMGSELKMDYTIMGNSVNLASRLEGVNKQYGTWILASEVTRQETGEAFAWREMDPVQVKGIKQSVRLYELLDESSALDATTREAVEIFHRGKALYENRGWDQAISLFEEVRRLLPGDGPADTFIKRCREYKKKPPGDSFPVFSLTVK